MSTPSPTQKLNLRRPEVLEQVQAQVQSHFHSELVERLRAVGQITSADKSLTVKLAKEFGFCYGVERAIDLAYAARKVFPHPKRVFLLGEIIHNPEVNDQIRALGIVSIPPKPSDEQVEELRISTEDVVIIPAFGTEVNTRKILESTGCSIVDTTCGDVMTVWKRVRQYARESITSIIHGKASHEETKATSSQATATNSGHYLTLLTLAETDYVCAYILDGGDKAEFLTRFKGCHSAGFDPDIHLRAVGVANQTTMMRNETEEVQRRIKAAMEKKYGAAALQDHFRFFDTICGATQDRQDALGKMLADPPDLLIVIGGYNSSNTTHLAEIGEAKLPTYFIKNAAEMVSGQLIRHWSQHQNCAVETRNWLPAGHLTVGVTAGASCPNNLIEDCIRRLFGLRGVAADDLLKN